MYHKGHIFITQTGFQNLKDSLRKLNEEQVKLGHDLREAQEPGKSNENGSYSTTCERKLQVEEQIQEINATLRRSTLINKPRRKSRVTLGSVVKLGSSDGMLQYTLVDSLEADPSRGFISYKSPAGQEMLGRRAGDKVEIGNGRKVTYTIKSIN